MGTAPGASCWGWNVLVERGALEPALSPAHVPSLRSPPDLLEHVIPGDVFDVLLHHRANALLLRQLLLQPLHQVLVAVPQVGLPKPRAQPNKTQSSARQNPNLRLPKPPAQSDKTPSSACSQPCHPTVPGLAAVGDTSGWGAPHTPQQSPKFRIIYFFCILPSVGWKGSKEGLGQCCRERAASIPGKSHSPWVAAAQILLERG